MVSAPVTLQRRGAKPRLITLGWSQFVALLAGLCSVVVVAAILASHAIYEIVYRAMAQQYERPLGFEIGLVKRGFGGPPVDAWGIVRVTPGGIMDRAGLRASDYVVGTHSSFPELYGAISAALEGGIECFAVVNADDARTGAYKSRLVCLVGETLRGLPASAARHYQAHADDVRADTKGERRQRKEREGRTSPETPHRVTEIVAKQCGASWLGPHREPEPRGVSFTSRPLPPRRPSSSSQIAPSGPSSGSRMRSPIGH